MRGARGRPGIRRRVRRHVRGRARWELVWTGAVGRQRDGVTDLAVDDSLLIGSVTKTFVAGTVLQLVGGGPARPRRRAARLPAGHVRHQRRTSRSASCSTTPAGSPTCSTTPRRRDSRPTPSTPGRPPRCSRHHPRAVVSAGRGVRVREHELLPARPGHRDGSPACPLPMSSRLDSSRRLGSTDTRMLTGGAR